MIEKRNDMRTLTAMGAPPDLVRRIFRNEGLLIVATGMVIGMVLGLLLCVAQQQFGLLKLQGSVVEHYPVVVQPLDLLIIAATVMAIGALAIGVPLRALQKRFLLA
jgi:ABC-type lipoprotein release transport system permease subunit